MLKGMINKIYLAMAVLGLFGGAFAAKVAPLYFESLGNSAAENADSQQEYWEGLMKYKLWGSEGLTFNKHTVHIADKNGYNGTATGDITFLNQRHHVGGPLLAGGNFYLSNTAGAGYDTLSGGPMRTLGDFVTGDYANFVESFFDGPYCIQGQIKTRRDRKSVV